MTHLWRNRKFWVIVTLLIVLLGVIWYASKDGPAIRTSRNVFRDIVAPAQQGFASGVNWFRGIFASIGELGNLRRDNLLLRQENDQLRQVAVKAQELARENERLQGLMGYRSQAPQYQTVPAKVIGWDPSNWSSRLLLNVGSNQGIAKDMAVITPQGVIGKVVQTSLNTAEVLLLIDETSAIGARVNPGRYLGIVRGMGHQGRLLRLTDLPLDAVLNPGDQVMSSGLGGVYPAGLVIGTVVSVDNEPSGLLKVARVRPSVDISRLDEVLVVRQATVQPQP